MPTYGPRCAKCGHPRRVVVAGRWQAVDCPCTTGAEPHAGPAPWHAPDDVHYSAAPRPTIAEMLKRRRPKP